MFGKFAIYVLALISLQVISEYKTTAAPCDGLNKTRHRIPKSFLHPIHPNLTRHVFSNNEVVLIWDSNVTEINSGHCEIIKVNPVEKEYILNITGAIHKPICFNDMLEKIKNCALYQNELYIDYHLAYTYRETEVITTTIFPETKWCGEQNIAINYHDLGEESDLDKCCRAFHLCPVSIPAGETRYGVKNYQSQTINHCSCSIAFDECVDAVTGVTEEFTDFAKQQIAITDCAKSTKEMEGMPEGRDEEEDDSTDEY